MPKSAFFADVHNRQKLLRDSSNGQPSRSGLKRSHSWPSYLSSLTYTAMPREMKATMHHQGHLVQQVSARKQQQQQQQWQKQQQSSKIVFPQKALNVPTALASSASPASPQISKQKASTKQSLLKYVGLGSLGKSPTKSPTKTPTKTVDTPEKIAAWNVKCPSTYCQGKTNLGFIASSYYFQLSGVFPSGPPWLMLWPVLVSATPGEGERGPQILRP